MAMIIKFQYVLTFFLCIFLFVTLFSAWFGFKSNDGSSNTIISNNKHELYVPHNRKMLAMGFDFTPLLHHHHRRHHHHQSHVLTHREPSENEIDQRYGVDKRLVPSGPDPLHH
ncbi:unnamed protein product [Lupinus luteus]|uniref:CLAVATA3/ESR (CLE)-related protein 13 n=1 Tax=Lupinus luteus TaxID=3873 RepID=A0AAV1WDN0_LUPLU